MGRYIAGRAVEALPLLLLVSIILFVIIQLTGDPLAAYTVDSTLTGEDIVRLRHYYGLDHLVLPSITLATVIAAGYIRYVRASMLEVIRQDYVRTARAKGLGEAVVLRRHAFKNAAIPLVTLMGLDLPRFLSGSVVVESIFAWPGMGRLFWEEAQRTDIPVLMAVLMFTSVLVVVFNLLADIGYAYLDPRIRFR